MGNEMPNRNLQADPEEEESVENKPSQQTSSSGIIPMDMPKSAMPSVEDPERGLGSGSKEETITSKETLALEAKTSVMEDDHQVHAKNSEDNMQKPAASHVAVAPDGSDDKIIDVEGKDGKGMIDHQEAQAVVPAGEFGEDTSSKNEEMIPNRTEHGHNEDGDTAPSQLEIAAMQWEDKHLEEAIRISHSDTKQPCPEPEVMTNNNKTKTDLVYPSSVNVNTVPSPMNACQPNMDITDTGSSDATRPLLESEDAAKKDPKLEHEMNYQDENKQAGGKDVLQSETQVSLGTGLSSTDIKQSPSPQASGSGEARGIQNDPVIPMQMPSQQQHGPEENFTDNKTFFANESHSSKVESTTIQNGLKPDSEARQDTNILHFPDKTMPIEANGLKESIKEPSKVSLKNNEMRERENNAEKEKILTSDMSNGFLHHKSIEEKEEKMALSVENLDTTTSVLPDKHELGKQEVSITSVEVKEKCMKPEYASEVLQENNSFVLHEEMERKEDKTSEMETELVKNPNRLLSKTDPIHDGQMEKETNLSASGIIQEFVNLPSPAKHVENSSMALLQEVKVESYDDKMSSVVQDIDKPIFKQFTAEVLQNEHDNGGNVSVADEALKEICDSESTEERNMSFLVETEDKSSSASVILLSDEVCQQIQMLGSESYACLYTVEDKEQDSNTGNKELDSSSLHLENKDQAVQCQSDWLAEEALNRMTGNDERISLEPHFNKLDVCKDSTSSTDLAFNQAEHKSDQILQNSSCLNKMEAPQRLQDLTEAASYEMQKEDAIGVSTNEKNAKNGMLSISDKESPPWTSTNITTAVSTPIYQCTTGPWTGASTIDEPRTPDVIKEGPIPTEDKTKYTPSSDSEMLPSDYLSCPKLESWHQESEDDLKTPLLASAQGSPEQRRESGVQSDLGEEEPKMSLERTDSEKVRTPLRHFFKEDSTVAGSEQGVMPSEQGNSKTKSVEDVWGSPARLVSTPSTKEKQKSRSIFSQCICCSAVH